MEDYMDEDSDQIPQSQYPDLNPSGVYAPQTLPYYIPGYEHTAGVDEFYNALEAESEDPEEEEDDDAPLEGIPFIPDLNEHLRDDDFELPEEASESDSDKSSDDTPAPEPQVHSGEGTGRRGAARGRGGRGGRGRGRGWGLGPGSQGGVVRNRGGARGRPRGSKMIPPDEGMRGSKKGKRGPRAIAEPSPEFRSLQGHATTAFLEGDFDTAADFARKAIQNNPEVFAAHSLLSQIYLEMGNREESLAVLWSGAHTKRETGVWWEVAHRTKELAGDDATATSNQLMYCYSQIIRIDADDFDARKGRLDQYVEQNFKGKAIRECERMLKLRPHDLDCLQMLAELCKKGQEVQTAKKAYESAVRHYLNIQRDGFGGGFTFSDLNIYLEIFSTLGQWEEGIETAKSLARWLCGRRDETYWDRYQENDCEWDIHDSPRRISIPEFQPSALGPEAYGDGLPPEIRAKLGTFRLRLGSAHLEEALHHFNFFDPEDISDDAPVNDYPDLFREIADILHENGHHAEALRFFEPLRQFHNDLDMTLTMKMAKSYQLIGALREAIAIYEDVVNAMPENTDVRVELAKLYEKTGEAAKAFEHVASVIKLGREDVVKKAKLNTQKPDTQQPNMRKPDIQKPKTQRSRTRKPTDVAASPVVTEREEEEDDPDTLFVASTAKPKAPRVRKRQAQRMTKRTPAATPAQTRTEPATPFSLETLHAQLQTLTPDMQNDREDAVLEWISIANELIQAFMSARVFFPTETFVPFLGYTAEAKRRAWNSRTGVQRSEMEIMADRLKTTLGKTNDASSAPNIEGLVETPLQTIPDNYRHVLFSSWIDVFLELAFTYAHRGDAAASYATLTKAAEANVFYHSAQYLFRIHVCWFTCALQLADEERLCVEARWFVKTSAYATDAFRLFALLNRAYAGAPNWYNSGPVQKFFLRTIKQADYALLTEQQRAKYNFTDQERLSYLNAIRGGTGGGSSANSNANTNSKDPLRTTTTTTTTDDNDNDNTSNPYPSTHDPYLLLMYGHLLAASGSHLGALNYYLRAYAVQPTHALTSLCIGLAYLQHALKRQCDNRHAYVLQGVAFVREYRRLRLLNDNNGDDEGGGNGGGAANNRRMEVEFNEARAWQLLGLLHLAVPAYERVLRIARDVEEKEKDKDDVVMAEADGAMRKKMTFKEPGFAREAAYALQGIYAVGGDVEMAREVTERWLVF